ncbi:DUF5906 domain-containing protein [Pediococcus pentosaceus]|uniref:DUF5906 domain-containing protein n=1 Tax=Pediococcus pentosaceus TaxID=1255 RepID=UPI003982435E
MVEERPMLPSVNTFLGAQIPFSEVDEVERGMNTEFVDNFRWLELHVQKNGKYKYAISSIVEFAKWLIRYDNLVIKNDWGYLWNGSFWDRVSVKQINNMVDVSIMTITDRLKISSNKKRELQKDVKPYLIERSRNFDDSVKSNYIGFKNWTLNVNENNFFEPKKEMAIIDGFDFEPIPNEIPKTWVAYADYMFGQNAPFLWAWLGYAFQAEMSWKQGALFLLDPIGGTGKTHFVTKITQAMFGSARVGAFKLKNLQGNNARFETARFVGKSLMVDDDATKVRFREDDTFKSVTGGGLSPVERKGIDGTDYRITAKMIVNVNEMPIFNNSGAIKRRLHIIKTKAPIATAEEIRIRDVLFPEEKLQAEKPMLATYAIEQYQKAVKDDLQIVGNIADDIVALDPFERWRQTLLPGIRKSSKLYDEYFQYYNNMDLAENDKPMTNTAWGRKMANWYEKLDKRDGKYYEIS